jgi:hypothetical protein
VTPAELKAIMKSTTEVAMAPVPITHRLPGWAQRNTTNLRSCPTNLIRATIVEDGVPWEEEFTFICGDQVHSRQRRNSTLVEFVLPEGRTMAAFKALPYTKVIKRDGQKLVQMQVSRKVLVAPWGEYAMVQAEEQKIQAERDAANARLKSATDALGLSGDGDVDRAGGYYRIYADDEGDHPLMAQAVYIGGTPYYGRITITLAEAEALAKRLAA